MIFSECIGADASPLSGAAQALNLPQVWEMRLGTLDGVKYRSRHVLAERLKQLMASRPRLATARAVEVVSDRALSKSNVDRVAKAQIAVSLDTLDDLAEVFGVSPQALLAPAGSEDYDLPSDEAREVAEDFDLLPAAQRAAARAQIDLILSGSSPTPQGLRRAAERMQQAADRMEQAADDETAGAPRAAPSLAQTRAR